MTTLVHQVRIDAPVSAVWRIIADLEAVRHYNPLVASVRVVSGKREGLGAKRRCEFKPKGWAEEQVWDWNPLESIGIEVTASDWPISSMKWRTLLRGEGAVTVVSQSLSYRLKFGFLGALLDAMVMRRKMDKNLREIFENLKRYAEAENAKG